MSAQVQSARKTVKDIAAAKTGAPLVCLTAYTAPMASFLDDKCDLILVGDSVGMVVHGLPTTVGVTLDMMILHGQAVMRASKKAFVVVDMPFGSYEESREQAFRNAARVLKETGAGAIKLEGGAHMAETGNPTRVCSVGCIYALMTALGPESRVERLSYHQAVTMEIDNAVTCAAYAFTAC